MLTRSGGQAVTREPIGDVAMPTRQPIGDVAILTSEPIGDVAMVTRERWAGGASVLTRERIGGADLLTREWGGAGAAVRIQNRRARGADVRGRGRLAGRTDVLTRPRWDRGTGRGHPRVARPRRAHGRVGCATRGVDRRPGVAGCGRIGR